jgi:hypothetical protein
VCIAVVIRREKAHAPYYIAICGPSGSTIFFRIIKGTIIVKRITEHKNVFFSVRILPEIFLIPRLLECDIMINVHRSSCKVAVTLVRFQ